MNTLTKSKIEDGLHYKHFYSGLQFENLPIKERLELESAAKLIHLQKKEVLYQEGELPKGLYVLQRGKLKFSQLNFDGSVQIQSIYGEGDMFGHRTILSNGKFGASAIALEECALLFIEKDYFLDILKSSTRLSNLLLESMSHELTVLSNRVNIFAQKTIKERLAFFLITLNEKYKTPDQITDEAEIKVNRSDLASYTGTSLENLVRTLREFRDKNLIRTTGKSIYITDFDALFSLTGMQVNL